MKKVLKIVGIIIAFILVLFIIHIIRNYSILCKINKNVAKYVDSNNVHMKITSNQMTVNSYKKDDKEVAIMEKDNVKISIYKIGEKIDQFVESEESKTAKLNFGSLHEEIPNIAKYDTEWQRFLCGFLAIIRSKKYKDIECYTIDNLISPYYLVGEEKSQLTIEKDTGLLLKGSIDGVDYYEREYEFNNVDDSVFIEPDISQYKVE